MARNRYRKDRGLSWRMGAVGIGLGALYVTFGLILIYFTNFAFGLIVVLGMSFGQWYFSDRLALASMRAKVVTPQQAPELHAMVDRLCAMANMPKPKVAVAVTDVPNAFATGRSPKASAVCVTTGILQRLDADELEGVMAHELAHVAHRDVSVMTVASSLSLLAGFLTRWGLLLGGGRNRQGAVPFILIFLVSMVVYFLSFLLTRALSRYRELSADRAGAYLTGQPAKLASALHKISGGMEATPTEEKREVASMNAFFIVPALVPGSLQHLLATHPSLHQRLSQLDEISKDLNQPPYR